jgi:hypothetical protein
MNLCKKVSFAAGLHPGHPRDHIAMINEAVLKKWHTFFSNLALIRMFSGRLPFVSDRRRFASILTAFVTNDNRFIN